MQSRDSLVAGCARPWLMAQSWHDLLFAHWPMDPDQLRRRVPAPLVVDTFDDHAWLSVVAFRLSNVHLRGLPNPPGVAHFPEVNLRTYVSLDGRPGVLFLSLHCPNRLAIALARPAFWLPYHYARIHFDRGPDGLDFASRSPSGAGFAAAYRPVGAASPSEPGSLAEFLTERYCYYAVGAGGAIHRCDVQHRPWRLTAADADVRLNTLASTLGLDLSRAQPPVCHFADHVDAHIWPLQRVATASGGPTTAWTPARAG